MLVHTQTKSNPSTKVGQKLMHRWLAAGFPDFHTCQAAVSPLLLSQNQLDLRSTRFKFILDLGSNRTGQAQGVLNPGLNW